MLCSSKSDKPGRGLSDRNRTDFSLDFEITALESIVKELGLKSFVPWTRSVEAERKPTLVVHYRNDRAVESGGSD
jgi:hypothetical protein